MAEISQLLMPRRRAALARGAAEKVTLRKRHDRQSDVVAEIGYKGVTSRPEEQGTRAEPLAAV